MSDFEVQRSSKANWFACVDVLVLDDERLTPIEKVVFCLLCRYTNWQNRECYPSIKIIAKKANCSERSVVSALKKLIELGLIVRQERFVNGRQTTSLYKIIGFETPCYEPQENGGGCSTFTPPCNTCTHEGETVAPRINDNNNNYITLTREAELPEKNPDLSEVPEIMRSTAELLLFKTGRKALTEGEISALKELARNQVPARVQKEIAVAVERFKRQDRDLKTLHFEYIANALAHQPTRGKAGTKQAREKIRKETQEFDAIQNADNTVSDEEFEALMAEIHGGRLS